MQHTAAQCNPLKILGWRLYGVRVWRDLSIPCVYTARHCDTLQHTATHCSTLHHTATHCNTLKKLCSSLYGVRVWRDLSIPCVYTATHCNALQRTATHCNALQHTATHCHTLQHTQNTGLKPILGVSVERSEYSLCIHCNTLQHIEIHCDILKNMCWILYGVSVWSDLSTLCAYTATHYDKT